MNTFSLRSAPRITTLVERLTTCAALASLLGSAGCVGPEEEPPATVSDAGSPLLFESLAPLCDDIESGEGPNAFFTEALLDPASVTDTVVLGDMDPVSPQEILNFELGFYVPGTGVPLTSPADLYVNSIERSYHANNDVTDFGLSYELCSYQDGATRRRAVFGNFAHVTSLNADLSELFDAELQKLVNGEASAMSCSGDAYEECTLHMSALREQLGDPSHVVVLEAGTPLGTAGPAPGKTAPSGIDANLFDVRKNDFRGNYFLNPDRLGAEGGHGVGWRYGACTYEYFVEPYRTEYLQRIKNLGAARVSAEAPCGTLEIDKDADGTAGGLWALTSIEDDVMQSEYGGAELDAYLLHLLALVDHLTAPDTKMMLSTSIDALSNLSGGPSLIEIDKALENDEEWNKRVNVPFKQTEPGVTYCYAGTRYGGFQAAYYLIALSQDGSEMTLQRVEDDCTDVAPEARTFDPGADSYFTFKR